MANDYGPFAEVVAVVCALAAVFSVTLLRSLGSVKQWAGLGGNQPPLVVTAGARGLALAVIALAYLTINHSNYLWFAGLAVVIGILGFMTIIRFDRLRRRHVLEIPLVGSSGRAAKGGNGRARTESLVIGAEVDL